MSDLPDSHPSDTPPMKGPRRRSAVSRSEEKLAALRLAIVQAKRQLHIASVREQSIREGTLGRAVWRLIEQGRLEPCVVALIRDEIRPFLSPARAGAFLGTVFELQSMPAGSVGEPTTGDTAVPPAEQEISATTQPRTTRFRLPALPVST